MLLNNTIHTFRGGLLENKCIRPSLFIIFFLFCLLSCNNLEQGPDTFLPISQTKYVTVTGKILPADGAMPASRSAFASLPAGITYHISASASIGGSTVTLSDSDAVINTSTMTYTLTNIPVSSTEIDWTVDIWIADSSNQKILGASKTLPLSDTSPIFTYDFVLKPNYASGNGKIGLEMTVDSSVKRVTASCTASGWTSASPSVNLSSTTVTITSNAIATGSYSIQFDFWDNTTGGTLLYSDTQTINVISFMETDTWVYTGGSGPIKTDGTYELTTALINDFVSTTFYVGNTGYGTPAATNSGTAFSPLQTIEQAGAIITARNKASTNYTIIVYGTLTGPQSLPATLDGKAASVAIKGYGTNATLDGNSSGSTFSIKTSVPVIISDLTLTGGTGTASVNNYVSPPTTTYYGGGMYIDTGSTVTLASDTKIYGNSAGYGAGIYNKGTLILKDNSIIGDLTSRTEPASSTGGSNRASIHGGGIYTSGTVWIGYTQAAATSPDTSFSGGIGYNSAGNSGGGIYIGTSGTVYMSKGQISYNSSNGGSADEGGGGVYIASTNTTNLGLFHMNGGAMNKNWHRGSNGGGGAVYIAGHTKMTMSGDAKITYEGLKKSDVYSARATYWSGHIEVTGALSNTAVATIVPSGLEAGRKLVTLDTDQTDWDTITPKFLLQSTETSIAYYGLDEGCLWPNMDNWGTGMATNFANSSGTLLTAFNGTETEIMHSVIDATVVIVDSSNNTLVLNISQIQDDMSGKVYKLKFKRGAQPVVTRYFTFDDIDFISQENMYYNISGDELGGNGTAVIGITNLHGNTSNPIISLYAEPRTSKYLVLPTMYD